MTPSTAEALAPVLEPAPFDLAARRRSEIAWWLRASISREEAEAFTSQGYRPTPCGGCGTCWTCNQEPAEQVQPGKGGRRSSADPRFVGVIVQRLSAFSADVTREGPRALASLPAPERLVLLLELGAGLSQPAVANRLKVSLATVKRLKGSGLDRMVRLVWG